MPRTHTHAALEEAAAACAEMSASLARLAKALAVLAENAEDAHDLAAIASSDLTKTIPGEVVHALLENDASPIREVRKWRGLTQAQLAEAAGIRQSSLSSLEARPGSGTVETLCKIAKALDVDVEMLIPGDLKGAGDEPAETEAA